MFRQNALFQVQTALNRGVEDIRLYTRDDIDPGFLKKNAAILHQKTGAGYWLWKPYIILKTLNDIPDGDIVLYLDSGMSIQASILPLVSHLKENDMIVFRAGHNNRGYMKRDAVVLMGMEDKNHPNKTEELFNAPMICATLMAVKNSAGVRAFMQKWLSYGEKIRKLLQTFPVFIKSIQICLSFGMIKAFLVY